MKHKRGITKGRRKKYFMLVAAFLFFLAVFGFISCSTSSPEQEQTAQQTTVIQGDAIDAPASASAAPGHSNAEQKPEALTAENLYASAQNTIGKKPAELNPEATPSSPAAAVSSAASKGGTAQSPAPEENLNAAAKPAAATPAATALSPEAASAAPVSNKHSEYQRITLGLLGSFRYEYPDPTYLESEEDPSKLKLKDQFPPNLKALHGKKVSIMGYIMPIDVDEEWRVKTLTLVRDQMVCCFGNVPEINEWVYVRLKTPQRADQLIDVPVIVFGTLEVGEEIKFGTLANVYRIEADRVSTNY